MATLRPIALRSCSSTAARCAGVRSCAATTAAVTSPLGELAQKAGDDLGQNEKPAVLRQDTEEVAHQRRQLRLGGNRLDRLALRLARHHRAADQTAELRTVAQHGAHRLEVAGDGVELLALVGEIEQRRAIALSEPGYAFRFGCHVGSVLVSPGREIRVAVGCRKMTCFPASSPHEPAARKPRPEKARSI